ncbi:MAG: hypothetical protein JST53_10165, partial [Actinobacteria bacterium]|nr:hypothetical protein [Actinomycetota bacterium]
MFRGRGAGRSAISIAISALCAVGTLWVGAAGAASPGIDPGYGEGGILRTGSEVPAGYTDAGSFGTALAGANGSVLYVSSLNSCANSYETGCVHSGMVRRFTSAGSLDGTYGEGGVLDLDSPERIPFPGAATDSRGRLFVAESHEGTVSVRRFTARGKPDKQFGTDGEVSLGGFAEKGVNSLAVLMAPAGRLVVAVIEPRETEYSRAADRVTLIRLLPGGRVDPSYGKKGRAVVGIPSAYGVKAYESPQGATLLVGHICCSADDFTPVHRVAATGKVDVHFDSQERRSQVKALAGLAEPEVTALIPRADGTIELFGSSRSESDPGGPGFVLRLWADGSLERHFGDGGMAALAPNVVDAEAGSGRSSLVS